MGEGRMTDHDVQAEIDRISWYHEFDFGRGLRARSHIENVEIIRQIWQFIEQQLDRIDFRGKSVLEIGAWDGYWSFYAERRGAASVLATDDVTQNWADGRGLPLARALLGSRVEIRQDVSIYDLSSLNRQFDIILCLGVFYHLRDPFYGFTQIRHCCRPGTCVVVEGELGWTGMHLNEVRHFYNPWLEFLPSPSALEGLLKSAYLRIDSQVWMHPHSSLPDAKGEMQSDRALIVCAPFDGTNDMYAYKPHFGLHVYDERFRPS
jgi:tRNA (mo5U34)-methyltransferase